MKDTEHAVRGPSKSNAGGVLRALVSSFLSSVRSGEQEHVQLTSKKTVTKVNVRPSGPNNQSLLSIETPPPLVLNEIHHNG